MDNKNRPTERLYAVKKAAKYLGISTWTMRELGWAGKVPPVRFNRRIYFDLRDLDDFIDKNKFSENP